MKGTEQGKEAERKREKKQSEEQSRGEKRKKETAEEQIAKTPQTRKAMKQTWTCIFFFVSLRAFLYFPITQSTHSLWHVSITSFNLLPLLFSPPFIFFCLYIGVVPPHWLPEFFHDLYFTLCCQWTLQQKFTFSNAHFSQHPVREERRLWGNFDCFEYRWEIE